MEGMDALLAAAAALADPAAADMRSYSPPPHDGMAGLLLAASAANSELCRDESPPTNDDPSDDGGDNDDEDEDDQDDEDVPSEAESDVGGLGLADLMPARDFDPDDRPAPWDSVRALTAVEYDAMATYDHIDANEYKSALLGRSDDFMDTRCQCHYNPETDSINMACGEGSGCINRELYIECTPGNCPSGRFCQNRRMLLSQAARIEVFHADRKGFGIRALEDLEPSRFVFEYVGEVISRRSFLKRAKQYAREGARHFYFMSLQKEEVIDAQQRGGVARFVNHSCNPNCETQKWVVGGRLRIGLFTTRAIPRGTELTFDYKFERYGAEAQPCYCGEPNCSGIIGVQSNKRNVDELEAVHRDGESGDSDADSDEDSEPDVGMSASAAARLAARHGKGHWRRTDVDAYHDDLVDRHSITEVELRRIMRPLLMHTGGLIDLSIYEQAIDRLLDQHAEVYKWFLRIKGAHVMAHVMRQFLILPSSRAAAAAAQTQAEDVVQHTEEDEMARTGLKTRSGRLVTLTSTDLLPTLAPACELEDETTRRILRLRKCFELLNKIPFAWRNSITDNKLDEIVQEAMDVTGDDLLSYLGRTILDGWQKLTTEYRIPKRTLPLSDDASAGGDDGRDAKRARTDSGDGTGNSNSSNCTSAPPPSYMSYTMFSSIEPHQPTQPSVPEPAHEPSLPPPPRHNLPPPPSSRPSRDSTARAPINAPPPPAPPQHLVDACMALRNVEKLMGGAAALPKPSTTPTDPLPKPWRRVPAPRDALVPPGTFYHWNPETGETRWDPPAAPATAMREEDVLAVVAQAQQRARERAEQQAAADLARAKAEALERKRMLRALRKQKAEAKAARAKRKAVTAGAGQPANSDAKKSHQSRSRSSSKPSTDVPLPTDIAAAAAGDSHTDTPRHSKPFHTAISNYVVKQLSKYRPRKSASSSASTVHPLASNDDFKRVAREVTHAILEHEPPTAMHLKQGDALSDKMQAKVKSFVKKKIERLLHKAKKSATSLGAGTSTPISEEIPKTHSLVSRGDAAAVPHATEWPNPPSSSSVPALPTPTRT